MNSKSDRGRVAVTGATGLLGGYIVAELIRSGYTDILLLVRDVAKVEKLYSSLDRLDVSYSDSLFRVVEMELNNPRELAEVFVGVDTIYHTAAVVSMSNENPRELIEINVEITSHVVNAAIESGVRLLVHTSSIAALGGMKKGKMYIDESTELENLSGTSPYGQSKFLSENEVWRASAQGLNVIVVNPAVILGVGDWQTGGSVQIISLFARGLPFYTKGVVGYVDVRDVARAEVAIAECDAAIGQRFILSAENLSFRDVMTLSAEVAGKRKPFFCAGEFITGIAWRVDKFFSHLSGRQPTLTESAAHSSQTKSYYCGEKIRKYINFDYTPIGKTIKEVVTAYIRDTKKS